MKPCAVLTGASSGIGEAIGNMLCEENYEVYGFGRDFSDCRVESPNFFHRIKGDLLDTPWLLEQVKRIQKDQKISLLI